MKNNDIQSEEMLLPELQEYVVKIGDDYIINHFLCLYVNVDPERKCLENYRVNGYFRMMSKKYKKFLKDKNYDLIICLMDERHRMKWFIDNYEMIFEGIGEEEYYSLLRGVLCGEKFHHLYKKEYHKILSIGTNPSFMMNESERNNYNKLPEKFLIYQGLCSRNRISSKNFKGYINNFWTRTKEDSIVVIKNNSYGSNYYKVVLTYEVSKNNVISYFKNNKELQIFVDYTLLEFNRINLEEIH